MLARKLQMAAKSQQLTSGYEYLDTFPITTTWTGSQTFTYTSVDLGQPAVNRYILAVVYGACTTLNTLFFTGATFAGETASEAISQQQINFNQVGYYWAYVPTGTTGTISWSATCTSSVPRSYIVLYAVYTNDAGFPLVIDSGFGYTGTSTVSSSTVNFTGVSNGDLIIGTAGVNNSSAHTWSPTFMNVDFQQVFGGNRNRTVASGISNQSGNVSVVVSYATSGIQAHVAGIVIQP